jgi:hypothetical protein
MQKREEQREGIGGCLSGGERGRKRERGTSFILRC